MFLTPELGSTVLHSLGCLYLRLLLATTGRQGCFMVNERERESPLLLILGFRFRLDVPGEHVKPVYLAALRLKMDRVAAECARFLASHLDLGSCLEIRSTPGVTNKMGKNKPENEEAKSKTKERKSSKDSNKNGSNNSENGDAEAALVPGKEGDVENPVNGAGGGVGVGAGAAVGAAGAQVEETGEETDEHVDLVSIHKVLGSISAICPKFVLHS